MTRHIRASRRIGANRYFPRLALTAVCMAILTCACGGAGGGGGGGGGSGSSCGVPSASGVSSITTGNSGIWYGKNRWTSTTGTSTIAVFGVTISSAQLLVSLNENFNEEEWMSDASGKTWIETGYGTDTGSTAFFWGDATSSLYTNQWVGTNNAAGVSAGTPNTRNDYSISAKSSNVFDVATAGFLGQSYAPVCATGFAGEIGLEVNDTTGTLSATPTCGGTSGFTAQQADFTNVILNSSSPPPPLGKLITAGGHIRAGWNGSTFTVQCT